MLSKKDIEELATGAVDDISIPANSFHPKFRRMTNLLIGMVF